MLNVEACRGPDSNLDVVATRLHTLVQTEAQWYPAMSLNLAAHGYTMQWMRCTLYKPQGYWSSVPSLQDSIHGQWHSRPCSQPEKIAVPASAYKVENPWHCRNRGHWVLLPGCHFWSLLHISTPGTGVSFPRILPEGNMAMGGFLYILGLVILSGGAGMASSNLWSQTFCFRTKNDPYYH